MQLKFTDSLAHNNTAIHLRHQCCRAAVIYCLSATAIEAEWHTVRNTVVLHLAGVIGSKWNLKDVSCNLLPWRLLSLIIQPMTQPSCMCPSLFRVTEIKLPHEKMSTLSHLKGYFVFFEVGSYKVHIYSRCLPYRNHWSAQPQFGEVESRSSPDAQLCTAVYGAQMQTEF